MRSSRLLALALAAAAGAALAAAAPAAGALTAQRTTIADRPGYVQAVVAFTGGTLTGLARQTEALDPSPANGRAVVRVNAAGIRTRAPSVTAQGVTARIRQRPGNVVILLDGGVDRFTFVQYGVDGSRTRLVIRLWKATTVRGAARLDDGCLRLTRWSGGRGTARARGLELQPLFEHGLVLSLRAAGAGERTIALRPVTATEGVFLPDFSGYASPGRWRGSLPYSVRATTRAMLQAWSTSAKDGSLDCLVQVPVLLRP